MMTVVLLSGSACVSNGEEAVGSDRTENRIADSAPTSSAATTTQPAAVTSITSLAIDPSTTTSTLASATTTTDPGSTTSTASTTSTTTTSTATSTTTSTTTTTTTTTTPPTTTSTSTSTTSTTTTTGGGVVHQVEVSDNEAGENFYAPAAVTIKAGDTVKWTWTGANPHTVTADDGSFYTDALRTPATFSVTFDKPGVYRYTCLVHSHEGTVTVNP